MQILIAALKIKYIRTNIHSRVYTVYGSSVEIKDYSVAHGLLA
jgi:hypothetical protein